jgi:hypothetical protein
MLKTSCNIISLFEIKRVFLKNGAKKECEKKLNLVGNMIEIF